VVISSLKISIFSVLNIKPSLFGILHIENIDYHWEISILKIVQEL